MKGLEGYIRRHGRHFTVQLASKAISIRWSSSEVMKAAQRKVYYNVTSASEGDMVYLVNLGYLLNGWNKDRCIDFCLKVIGDYGVGEGTAFNDYIERTESSGFDFTSYI